MKKVDFLIVGQGLAGSLLSYHLLKEDKKIIVINNNVVNSSSKVAAGIFNPITGRRIVKTWNAENIFPYLQYFYSQLQKDLKASFYFPLDIYRPFNSIEEQNDCIGRSSFHQMEAFIEKITTSGNTDSLINDPFGGIWIKKGGFVNLSKMLEVYKQYLLSFDAYREEVFHEDQMILNENFVTYNNITAAKVIYCNGPECRSGIYFNWLPFNVVKGEVLVIKIRENIDRIISRGIYLLPLGNSLYKVGATYNWSDFNTDPTLEGKKELVGKVKSLLKIPFEVVEHRAGIRPATKDRRPFLGLHPLYKSLGIFNGLGSKGVSLAPYFAKMFSEFLVKGKELEEEVNISRYNSLYYN